MSNKTIIQSHNTRLNNLLEDINNLPEAGDIELPALDNEGAAADLLMGKDLINSQGEKITGVFTLEEELTTQDDLITQLQNMVESLPEAGGAELELQNKTVTPTTTIQSVKADSGYDGLNTVTVNAIPSTYIKPVTTKTATTYTPATSDQVIAAGTYCSGAQTIKGDANLVAENIVSGKSIFGVVGSATTGGGGSEPKMIEVTHDSQSATAYVFCFNSSYELVTVNRGSTVDALEGIVMHFGYNTLTAVSGNYTNYDTGISYSQIIKFTTNGGICRVYSSGGSND